MATLSAAAASARGAARAELARLHVRLGTERRDDALVGACLDALLAGLDADRVVLFLGHGHAFAPFLGRSRAGVLEPDALEEVSRSLVQRALDEGATVAWDAAKGGAPSATDLGILVARALPIGTPPTGVLYLDFRDPLRLAGIADDETLGAACACLALALAQEDVPSSSAEPGAAVPTARPASLEELLALPGQRALRDDVLTALITDLPVLVTGETGTGKTLLAQALAERTQRKPVVRAMLGASDDLNTIASELFGHEKGAYSGAAGRRVGLVEHADGGVLILDEVINLPLAAQQLLLDLVQFGTYRPLGFSGAEPRLASVRILAVTNGDLDGAVRAGRFRRDLFHRLAGVHLHVPPLRARRGDIPGIAGALLARLAPGERWTLSRQARQRLLGDDRTWDGNTRELEALLRRALARARVRQPSGPCEVAEADLDAPPRRVPPVPAPTPGAAPGTDDLGARWTALQAERGELERRELALVDEAMARHGGVVSQAARALGVARTTLSSRLSGRGER